LYEENGCLNIARNIAALIIAVYSDLKPITGHLRKCTNARLKAAIQHCWILVSQKNTKTAVFHR